MPDDDECAAAAGEEEEEQAAAADACDGIDAAEFAALACSSRSLRRYKL